MLLIGVGFAIAAATAFGLTGGVLAQLFGGSKRAAT